MFCVEDGARRGVFKPTLSLYLLCVCGMEDFLRVEKPLFRLSPRFNEKNSATFVLCFALP